MKKYSKFLIFAVVIYIILFATVSCAEHNSTAIPAVNPSADPVDIAMLRANAPPPTEDIEFSLPSGFYNDSVRVELTNRTEDYTLNIRYTTDGSAPTASSSLYSNGIRRSADSDRNNVTSLVIRAALFEGEKIVSRIFTNSYILGYKMEERFDVPVVCVSTGNENLWNHDYGIFADGRLREEWIARQPGRARVEFTSPANWWARGKEWERPAYVEIFEPDGTRVIAQDAGIRIHGGWSRGNGTQRSLRIYARSEYDPNQTSFDYAIFPNNTSLDGTNKSITSFKRLTLRNGGNDFGSTRIRDEVTQDIAALYGLDMQNSRAGVIFLNGELYGILQIKHTLNRFTLKDLYNAPNDDFTVLKNGSSGGGYRASDGDPAEERNYTTLVKEISRGLARTEEGRKELEEQMDVYNVLKYYAFQTYIGNGDWPHNNYKIYKYNAPELNAAGVNQLDGRWRYWLYDTDFGMGLAGDYRTDILGSCIRNKGDGGLFSGLMQSDEYKSIFVKLMCDLINVYYTNDNLFYYIGARSLEIVREIPLQLSRTGWNQQVTVMYEWVDKRPAVMYNQMTRHLKLDKSIYQINLKQNTEGGNVYINEFELSDTSWIGQHYENTGAEMSAVSLPGWKLEKWIINGKNVNDKVILLDKYISDDNIDIEAVFIKDNTLDGVLVINEINDIYYDVNGEHSYIELYNPTNSEVSTEMYSLVIHNHDENTQIRHEFGSQTIAPFSFTTVYFYDFTLKSDRDEIRLIYSDTVRESMYLPNLEENESYGRYPDGGDKFVYLQKSTPNAKNELGSERIKEFEYMKNRVLLTGRLQDKSIIPIRENGQVYVPLAAFDDYNGSNPRAIQNMAKEAAVTINGGLYVPLSAFEGTQVRINEIIVDRLNSVIIYK